MNPAWLQESFSRLRRLPPRLYSAFFSRGLNARLMGFLTLGILVPVFLTAFVVTAAVRRSLLSLSLREQDEVARRVGDRVAGYVDDVKKVLRTLVSRGGLARASPSEVQASLRELLRNYPHLMEAAVLGPDGREREKMARRGDKFLLFRERVGRAGRDEFRRALAEGAYVGPVFFTQRDRFPQMFVSVALGGGRGVLLARLSLDGMWDLVSEASAGIPGHAYIVDGKGVLIAHPERDRVLVHESLAEDPVARLALSGGLAGRGRARAVRGGDGRPVLATARRIPGLDWSVVLQTPLREVLAPVRVAGRRAMAAAVVLGGLFLVLGLSLARKILEPLRILHRGVRRIGEGDLSQRLDVRTGDELQALAEEFNAMAESLQRLEETKRDLTHMIVHDLKSPMSSLLGSMDYVLSSAKESLSPDHRKLLTLGAKSGRDLLRLIQNLLDLAKMEEGRLEIRPESFSLLELAAQCVDDLEANIHREGKTVSVEVPKSLPKAWADRDLLHRVLSNLLTNAFKHTDRGGEISLQADAEEGGAALVLSVRDDGEGIPPEFLEKIFEKFSQAEGRRRSFRVGSGLGLTFCKIAVEAHGGRIWVESELGRGSAFFVRLPLPAVPAAPPPPEPQETARV